ncbi:Cysteine protease [Phytophthora megakarya]|uniref:Cysteine protease n=1 Tax=Phytophthora megakarya TaxID=4795 RepID=A0A225X4X2_9STRA|nr:Cysteine protease [Phytophthora megakarya]
MVTQFLQDEGMETGPSEFRRRMEKRVDYLEQVHKLAADRDWAFSNMKQHNGNSNGDSQIHADSPTRRSDIARRWIAADVIETAVVVNSGTTPQSLSPQQFLECSSREMTATFDYCWAQGGVDGSTWLLPKMIWGSRNNACNGGMTHAAFADAAQLQWSLLSQLDMPYNEEDTSNASSTALANACDNTTTDNAAASITGWEQAVGPSCDNSSDPTELLKLALQQQPVSVAINSGGSFDAYKGGIYSCPNDGDFATSGDINHAVVLVGYGTDGSTDYWIIKNSYGASWGEKGFIRLAIDSKINCGLSVFPVIPTGASAGAAHTVVDGGGEVEFVGMSPDNWVILGIAVAAGTLFLTVIGVVYASRQRNTFKETLQRIEDMETQFVDVLGLETYNQHAGQEFQVSELVQGAPSDVFDAWIRDVWLAGGSQVHDGIGRGYVGSVRRVPLGVEEEILSAGLPEELQEQDKSSKIPSICYRVRNPVWTVKTEMSATCNWLHCGGFIRLIFRTALKSFLRSLAKKTAHSGRMKRNHLDPTRYVDVQAFEQYQRFKGQELVVSECVVGSPSEVFDAWLEEVWVAGGTELHEGEGRGYVGNVRGVSGIEEEILSAGLPIDEVVDSDGGRPSLAAARRDRSKIPSVCYQLNKFGLFPIQSHLAFVQFVDVAASPESNPATLVIWSLKMEPSLLGYLLCCGGFTKFLLRSALQGHVLGLPDQAKDTFLSFVNNQLQRPFQPIPLAPFIKIIMDSYVDTAGFEAYAESDGQELALNQLVSASVDDAYDAWLRMEWVGRGTTLKDGEGRGLVGHRRLVSLGVEEKILSAGPPDASDRIPSVRYRIEKSGPLLLSDHVALVQFVVDRTAPPSQPKTLIVWNSKLTPSTMGSVLLCGGSISRLVLRTVLSSSLQEIAASFQQKK